MSIPRVRALTPIDGYLWRDHHVGMMLFLLSLLLGCGPTPAEACVSFLESMCACDACDGDTPETRAQACADSVEADIDFYECRIEVLEARGAACKRDTNTQECNHLQGGDE